MGWSGFNGQKYHMRHKPRKAFKIIKRYQNISSTHNSKLATREEEKEIHLLELLKTTITFKSIVWISLISILILVTTVYVIPVALSSLFREKATHFHENEKKRKDMDQAYHVLSTGGSNAFNQGYYKYCISEMKRAHRIYPKRMNPIYMLAVSYSELCRTEDQYCKESEKYSQLFLYKVKNDDDWRDQRAFFIKEYSTSITRVF